MEFSSRSLAITTLRESYTIRCSKIFELHNCTLKINQLTFKLKVTAMTHSKNTFFGDKRSIVLSTYLTSSEVEKIKKSARGQGVSMAEFIRQAALGRELVNIYDLDAIAELESITNFLYQLIEENIVKKSGPPNYVIEYLQKEAKGIMERILDSK